MSQAQRDEPVDFHYPTTKKWFLTAAMAFCLVMSPVLFAIGSGLWLVLLVTAILLGTGLGYWLKQPVLRVFEDRIEFGGGFADSTTEILGAAVESIEYRDPTLGDEVFCVHYGEISELKIPLKMIDDADREELRDLLEAFAADNPENEATKSREKSELGAVENA